MKRPSLETPVATASWATVILALGRDVVWKLGCKESRNGQWDAVYSYEAVGSPGEALFKAPEGR
jgi:hypothetical protein